MKGRFTIALTLVTVVTILRLPTALAYDTSGVSGFPGFDACDSLAIADMHDWFHGNSPQHSPFYDAGFYLGGNNTPCTIHTQNWVDSVINQGWGLMPLWVGLQAWCQLPGNNFNLMDHTTSNAESQGMTAAENAVDAAQARGLNGSSTNGHPTVIYYDMEAYDTTNSACVDSVHAYMKGWVSRLHALNYKAGWYGSSCGSNPSDLWNSAAEPDQAWFAESGGHSVWGISCVSDSKWNDLGDRRLHQFGHNGSLTISGSGPFNVDYDCLQGRVDPNSQDDNINDPNEEPTSTGHQDTEDPNCSDWFTPG